MGICESDSKYRYEEKGVNEKHNHMLIFSNPCMRNNKPDFICDCCSKEFKNIGSFHCITCNFNICRECFDYSGGIIYNTFTEGQKGQIKSHEEHVLIYGKSNSKGVVGLTCSGKKLYACKICGAHYFIDFIKCWSCPLCDYDVCDKCFKENGGVIYTQ